MKSIIASLTLALTVGVCYGVPARPGVYKYVQPDGTVIEASLVGDENFHYYRDLKGRAFVQEVDGYFRRIDETMLNGLVERARAKTAPGEIARKFPTVGTVRGLVVMAEFQDLKFLPKTTREYIDRKINSENYVSDEALGSAADFFREQSGGVFTPVFDVVGPVTLPHERAYYGLTEDLVSFYKDAADAADTQADVDFSIYDVDNNGFVDFLFVIYPGHGEAQGGPTESIWPAMMDLSSKVYKYYDGMNLSVAACSCELKGADGENWDGVGTICHEFSHILGLPDVYDARLTSGYGMGHYDLMDVGPYNADGRIPAGYTAMDRYSLGWLEPEILDSPEENLTLEPLSTGNRAYFIVNPENPNEYYTLENRQLIGFDAGLPGHGLVISYIHYDEQHWRRNTLNSPTVAGYEHIHIMAADNRWEEKANEAGDPFPGTKGITEFTDDTAPAAIWRTTVEKKVGRPITNIREDENGLITFDFNVDGSGMVGFGEDRIPIRVSGGSIEAPSNARIFNLSGLETGHESLPPGVYIVATGEHRVKVVVR